ncbi:MAG: superoxide dismutase family protein [Sorangiineae bacterium]|nr:superoxide dismutase family protein [Polyangiaceae bacterium]MEB2321062.1 superoxide dismutase family protein [Sorangiineae bacterium]
MKRSLFALSLWSTLGLLAACGGAQQPEPEAAPTASEPAPPPPPPPPPAEDTAAEPAPAPAPEPPKPIEGKLVGPAKSKLTGTVTVSAEGDGVKVVVTVENAKPGLHGTHIHEKADCSAPDFTSAGGHVNPDGKQHGLPTAEEHHLGDLGNLEVGKDGKGTLEIVVKSANLTPGDPRSFADRAVIVHEKKDDGTPPMGGAGGRIGCGELKSGS